MNTRLEVDKKQAVVLALKNKFVVLKPGTYMGSSLVKPLAKVGYNPGDMLDIWFIRTSLQSLGWGTPTPARHKKMKIRGYGNCLIKITNPEKFLRVMVGKKGAFTAGEIGKVIRKVVVKAVKKAIKQTIVKKEIKKVSIKLAKIELAKLGVRLMNISIMKLGAEL